MKINRVFRLERISHMLISTIQSMDSLPMMKQSGIDAVIVSFEKVSIRTEKKYPISTLKDWKNGCKENGLKLYINALKLFMEEEIEFLELFMKECKEIDVDGIYYADEGVFQIAKELEIENKLIYQPETLVTNTPDVQFYLDLGVQSVCLAHELSLHEILEIGKKCPQAEVLIHGYFSILYSRRPLVSNYLHHLGKEKEKNDYTLIEQTRNEKMPILEDETGTHIFSAFPINSYDQIKQLRQCGIERFRIDNIWMSDEQCAQIAATYQKILQNEEAEKAEMISSDHWYGQKTVKKKVNE